MPFYVAEWLLDTQDLKPEPYTAYHRLLCAMWVNRSCSLPNDPAILRNRAGFSPQKWPVIWAQIEPFFEINEDGEVHSRPLTKHRTRARDKYAARSMAGSKGAAAKWRKSKGKGSGKSNDKGNGKGKGNYNQIGINTKSAQAREGSDFDLKTGVEMPQLTIDAIKAGKRHLVGHVSAAQAEQAINAGILTRAECQAVGLV